MTGPRRPPAAPARSPFARAEARLARGRPPVTGAPAEIRALAAAVDGLDPPPRWDDLRTYCTFIGYPRSGHSIVGGLLDAHPEAVIAHELDALGFVRAGCDAPRLYHLLFRISELHARHGCRSGPYAYAVPGQWQGRCERPRVIGDKKGGLTTIRLGREPALLDRLLATVALEHRFVHVVRHPLDNIATLARRQTGDLRGAALQYLSLCHVNLDLTRRLGAENVHEIHHEDFVAQPARRLAALCEFLGLDAPAGYLDACARIVYRAPHASRHSVEWPAAVLRAVAREAARIPFLARYPIEA